MTILEKQKRAKEYGISSDIGKKVSCTDNFAPWYGHTAEIVGWQINHKGNPFYVIRYSTGECRSIPAGKRFSRTGYTFVD